MTFTAHPTAIVDDGAVVGDGTRIWHWSHVSSGARVGAGCTMGQNVFVANHVTIGDNVKIQNNVSVYEGVTLEDNVFCGPSMVFTNVRTPRCSFPRNTSADYAPTRIKHDASIGANATIVCGVTVGEWAFIGAGSTVTKDVPAFALIVGVPGRRIGWACKCGEPLPKAESRLVCTACAREYTVSDEQCQSVDA